MKKTGLGTIAVMFLVFLFAPKAQAGILYFGLQGGISKQKVSFSDITFNPDTTFVYGAKAGIKLMMFAVELNYFRAAHNLDAEQPLIKMWVGRELDYSCIGVNVKWFFPLLIVQPYLTAGYGYTTADIHDIDKDKNGGFNVGAGVELSLGKRFSVCAEGRYHHVKLDITERSFKLGDLVLTGGLNLYF